MTAPQTPLSDARLREIADGCEGVTPGPWLVLRHGESDGEGHPWRHSWEVRQEDSAPTDKHHWPARIAESVAGVYPVSPSPDADHIARLDPQTVKAMATELLAAREAPDGWRDVGYLMSIIDAAIEDGFDPDEDGPILDEIRAELKASAALAAAPSIASTEHAGAAEGVLRDLDYLIDDVVADAYVWGAEGRGTEISPQSAKTLHDAIAAALATHPVTVAEGEPALDAITAAIRKALTDNLVDIGTGVKWDVDVLLRGCQHAMHTRGYEKPEEAAIILATSAAEAVLALYRASPIQSEVGVKLDWESIDSTSEWATVPGFWMCYRISLRTDGMKVLRLEWLGNRNEELGQFLHWDQAKFGAKADLETRALSLAGRTK